MKEYKQVILVRKDLNLTKGKMAAQCSHASVEATLRSEKEKVKEWRSEGMKKSILKVPNLKSLTYYNQKAKEAGLKTALITDAGHTHIKAGTVTCLAIGPDFEEKIDKITGKLQLY